MEVDVSGVQLSLSGGQTTLSGIQTQEKTPGNSKRTLDCDSEPSKAKGVIKVTTYRIKKKSNSDGRSYRCSICGVRKRSEGNLNSYHRRRHEAQMCGICGKVFELASSLTHHMYTHDERRFFCEKCTFHCHFESKLKKHNVTHHSQPSHQCMRKNCRRWFKRKADLVLHVETHRKDLISCEICDYKTTLQKYLIIIIIIFIPQKKIHVSYGLIYMVQTFKHSGKRCIQRIAILFTMVMDTLISTLYNKNKNKNEININ